MLYEELEKMDDAGQALKRTGLLVGEYLVEECKLILASELQFENSVLKQKIEEMLLDSNSKSLGYGIYMNAWCKCLYDFYTKSEKTETLEILFAKMNQLTKGYYAIFDFTENAWKEISTYEFILQ